MFITIFLFFLTLPGVYLASIGAHDDGTVTDMTTRMELPVEEHERITLHITMTDVPLTSENYMYIRAEAMTRGETIMTPKVTLNTTSDPSGATFGRYAMRHTQDKHNHHCLTLSMDNISKENDDGEWNIHIMIINNLSKIIETEDVYKFTLAVKETTKCKRKGHGRHKSESKRCRDRKHRSRTIRIQRRT